MQEALALIPSTTGTTCGVHTDNLTTQEGEAGASEVHGNPRLHSLRAAGLFFQKAGNYRQNTSMAEELTMNGSV